MAPRLVQRPTIPRGPQTEHLRDGADTTFLLSLAILPCLALMVHWLFVSSGLVMFSLLSVGIDWGVRYRVRIGFKLGGLGLICYRRR